MHVAVLAFGLAGIPTLAEDGVTKDRIVFGQVAALEGPAQALGHPLVAHRFDHLVRGGEQ